MSKTSSDVQDGVVVGTIAYATIASVYGIFDLLAGRGLFHTVNLLGTAAFHGGSEAATLGSGDAINLSAVLLFNALHLVLSLGIGVAVLLLIGYAERAHRQALTVVLVLVSGFAVTVAAVGWLSIGFRDVMSWGSIILANALAVAIGAAYVVWQRPGVVERMVPPKHG